MFASKPWYTESVKAAQLVMDAFNFAKENRAVQDARRRANKGLYHLKHDPNRFTPKRGEDDYPYESDLHLPTVHVHVEGVATQTTLALRTNVPMAWVKPRTREDVQSAEKYGWYLNYQLAEEIGLPNKLLLWNRDMGFYDTKPTKIGWTTTSRRVAPRAFDPHTGRFDKGAVEEEVRGHPTWDGLDPFDVYVDPWATCDEDARFIIHRLVYTPEQLEDFVESTRTYRKFGETIKRPWEMSRVDKALEAARAAGTKAATHPSGEVEPSSEERLVQAEARGLRGGYVASDQDNRLIVLYDYWEDEVHIVTTGSDAKMSCLLREPNPFEHGKKPFIFLRFIQLDNTFEGVCPTDIIADLAHEKSVIRNHRMDEVNRNLNPWVFYSKNMVVDDDLLTSRPYGPIPVRGMPRDAVSVERGGNVTQNAYTEAQVIDQEIEEATGFGDPLRGRAARSEETVRGLAMRRENAGGKFEIVTAGIADSLKRGIKMIHSLNRQFLADSEIAKGIMVRVIGRNGKFNFAPMTFTDVNRDLEFEFTVDPTQANRAMHNEQMVRYLSSVSGNPEAAARIEWAEIHAAAFSSLGYRDDARRFIKGMDTVAQQENMIFRAKGVLPFVTPDDDDIEHIEAHTELLRDGSIPNLAPNEPELQRQAVETVRAHNADHQEQSHRKNMERLRRGA